MNFDLLRKHWVWPMLVTGISLLLTIYSAFLQHRSAQHEMGGSLMASFYQRSLNNREARTIVVCMEDVDVNLKGLYVTPTFDNPSEFSIKDLSLSFDVQCSNVSLVPSSFVETHSYGGNEWLYRYKDNLLAAHDDTKRIFTDYNVTGKTGHCFIETKASYDGASAAFEYNTDVWFLIVPKKRAQSYEDWKVNCKKRIFEVISDKYYDVYYYSHDNIAEYQFDVALVNDIDAVAPTPSPQLALKSAPQKEVKPQPTPSSSKPAEVKKKPATTEKVQREEKPVKVKPASNNQDVNIAKYSSSNSGKRFYINFELDNTPSTRGTYLLYGNYTVPGNVNPYVFAYPMELSTLIKSYKYSTNTIDSLTYHLNELRVIKETEPNGIIEITHDDGRRVIKNVTGNKIIVLIYTTYSYRCHILEKTEVIYDQKGNDNKIYVYDTGEKSTLNTNNKSSKEDKAEGGLSTILVVMIWSLVSVLGLYIIGFIVELLDKKSITRTLERISGDFKKAPFYESILFVLILIVTICIVINIIVLK